MHHPREPSRSTSRPYELQVSWSQPVLHDNDDGTTDVNNGTTDVNNGTTDVDDSTTDLNDDCCVADDYDHGEVWELGLR